MHNNLLTVSGESKFESDRDEHGYVVRERRFGRFSRSLPVPEGVKVSTTLSSKSRAHITANLLPVVQPEEIKAAMENGVLTVTYPRQTEAQAPKRVTIS